MAFAPKTHFLMVIRLQVLLYRFFAIIVNPTNVAPQIRWSSTTLLNTFELALKRPGRTYSPDSFNSFSFFLHSIPCVIIGINLMPSASRFSFDSLKGTFLKPSTQGSHSHSMTDSVNMYVSHSVTMQHTAADAAIPHETVLSRFDELHVFVQRVA